MAEQMMKWLLLAALVVVALLAIFTKKTFTVERVVNASKEEIWAVLVDTAAYPQWNPVFTEVNGEYVEGAKLINKVRDPKDRIIEMTASIAGSRLGRTLFYVQRSGVYDCEICGFPHIHHETSHDHRAVVVASEPLTHEQWSEFPEQCTWQINKKAELRIDDRPLT